MGTIIAIIILFGAIQGFAVCVYLYHKKKENVRAFHFYFLFLFSLAFFNFLYALKYIDIDAIGFIPLAAFPFPYKYLIGTGFYLYIIHQIPTEKKSAINYLLFLPAFCYGILRAYWYFVLHSGKDKDIFWNVYQSGFFTYNEYVYLLLNLLLVGWAIRFLKKNKSRLRGTNITRKNWEWLLKFSYAFLVFTGLHLVLAVIVHAVGDAYNGIVYSILLMLNSVYIYWVGFESLVKLRFLFNRHTLKEEGRDKNEFSDPLARNLAHYMNGEEIFVNKNLKMAEVAALVNSTEKELSQYIYETFGVSFSTYINELRVQKVKTLLQAEEQKKFTLLAIAENAGFNSKSSFNAVFKKVTGLTPTQYKEAHCS